VVHLDGDVAAEHAERMLKEKQRSRALPLIVIAALPRPGPAPVDRCAPISSDRRTVATVRV
jgi:hypothetical protein